MVINIPNAYDKTWAYHTCAGVEWKDHETKLIEFITVNSTTEPNVTVKTFSVQLFN